MSEQEIDAELCRYEPAWDGITRTFYWSRNYCCNDRNSRHTAQLMATKRTRGGVALMMMVITFRATGSTNYGTTQLPARRTEITAPAAPPRTPRSRSCACPKHGGCN